jgi:hypothetical protein
MWYNGPASTTNGQNTSISYMTSKAAIVVEVVSATTVVSQGLYGNSNVSTSIAHSMGLCGLIVQSAIAPKENYLLCKIQDHGLP